MGAGPAPALRSRIFVVCRGVWTMATIKSRARQRRAWVMIALLALAALLAVRISHTRPSFAFPLQQPGMETVDLSEDGSISQNPSSIVGIDKAHRLALRHRGVWIFVLDERMAVLFLRRSESAMTCPGTWSIVGEHTHFNETWEQSVLRGLQEELRLAPQQVSLRAAGPPQLFHLEYSKVCPARNPTQVPPWGRSLQSAPAGFVFHAFCCCCCMDLQFAAAMDCLCKSHGGGGASLRQVDAEENTASEWVPVREATQWIRDCPGGRCRGCLDAHNVTRWRPREAQAVVTMATEQSLEPVLILGGVGGLISDSLEHSILPRLAAVVPPLPTSQPRPLS
mmetsp:Transcript_37796/g.106803  ORF Transcript_37796/g.106803 Transcript_37796/m.106803 type:complete len:337 (+) Transcript_37796:100-1110(+)